MLNRQPQASYTRAPSWNLDTITQPNSTTNDTLRYCQARLVKALLKVLLPKLTVRQKAMVQAILDEQADSFIAAGEVLGIHRAIAHTAAKGNAYRRQPGITGKAKKAVAECKYCQFWMQMIQKTRGIDDDENEGEVSYDDEYNY